MDWSETLERALLAGVLAGKLGERPDVLPSDLLQGVRRRLLDAARGYRTQYQAWPDFAVLYGIVRTWGAETDEARKELRYVQRAAKDAVAYAVDEVRPLIKKEALRQAAIKIDQLTDGDVGTYPESRRILEAAMGAGEPAVPCFDYGLDPLARHQEEHLLVDGGIVCPTGIGALDHAMRGGLKSGEVGIILGPTKRGKSHFRIAFGAAWLKAGGYVVDVSLELTAAAGAGRYDRCLTGLDGWEIRADPTGFLKTLRSAVPDPGRLVMRSYPRYGLTISGAHDLLKKELDRIGKPVLFLLDYGAILRPEKDDPRHIQVAGIHEQLSSLAMTERVPCWTPYQTNRTALSRDGRVSMWSAGEAYASLCHVDVILALNQAPEDEANRRIEVNLEGARDTATASAFVQYDWSRTTLKELR